MLDARTRKLVLVGLIAGVALGSYAGPAAASHVRCGAVLKKDTTLDANVTRCAGKALVVGRSGITIDLNGHRVTGSGVGIDVSRGYDRVRIVDGKLAGFRTAVLLAGSQKSTLRRIRVTDAGGGIVLRRSHRTTIAGSRLSTRFTAVGLSRSDGNRVEGNILAGDSALSLAGSNHNVLKRNSISGGGHGIRLLNADHNLLEQNTVMRLPFAGIEVAGGVGNQLLANVASRNGRDGILVRSASATLRANSTILNGGLGINAEGSVADAGGNRASDNGEPAQCAGVACSG